MEHTIFTLVVLVIVAISKIMSNSNKGSKDTLVPPPRPTGPQKAPEDSEEERMRRFMEAVGLPQGSMPPPPVRPKVETSQAPLPTVVFQPNAPGRLRRIPLPTGAPVAPKTAPRRIPPMLAPAPVTLQVPEAEPLVAPVVQARPFYEEAAPGVPAIGRAVAASVKAEAIPASALLARLRNPASVREAVILREVLGPPKALQMV